MYLEDVDLAWRLQLLGWEAVFAPEARLYHHLSATGGGTLASYYTGRNTIWVIAKDMPGPLLRRYLGRIVAGAVAGDRDALRAWRGAAARRPAARTTGGRARPATGAGLARAVQRHARFRSTQSTRYA